MNFRDVELLSAYLDGQLSPSDSIRLESRLASDQNLQAVMDDLRTARGLLRQLPQRRVPHNFTLTTKMAGLKAPEPRVYPVFRLATVVAALLFMFTFVVNKFAPIETIHLSAAQAPASGMGGGCNNCGPAEAAPAATEAPVQSFSAPAVPGAPVQPFAAPAPTEVLPSTQDNSRNLTPSTQQITPKAAVPPPVINQPSPIPSEAPVPLSWQISIGIIAVICGAAAWFLRLRSEREFQKRWNKK
jgi:hypothetical protein